MIRERALKVVMALVGLLFVAGLYAIKTTNEPADQMLGVVYATPGVFLLHGVAQHVREPEPDRVHGLVEHRSCRDYGLAGIPKCDPARGSAARRASAHYHRISTDLARATEGNGGRALIRSASYSQTDLLISR